LGSTRVERDYLVLAIKLLRRVCSNRAGRGGGDVDAVGAVGEGWDV
jgi:hypothetical protein